MDPTLQAKIEEAKANGYSDEEINAYLQSQGQPVAQQQPIDRTEEYTGLAQGIGGEALKTGLELGGAYYLGKKLLGAFKGGPVSPAQAAQMGQAGQVAQNVSQAVRATGTGGAGAFNQMATQLGNNTIQFPKGPVAPTQVAPTQAPGMMQQGMDYVNRMRQIAAQRVLPVAGVPGSVAAGGAMATGLAGGQMGAMTPEQRKAYYDNMMLGAMGGDASLGAAIMNRGQ